MSNQSHELESSDLENHGLTRYKQTLILYPLAFGVLSHHYYLRYFSHPEKSHNKTAEM